MEFTGRSEKITFLTLILLIVAQPSQQYLYSCNSNASCGCSSNSASVNRIVGGEAAGIDTWGWAVSIYIGSGSLCGGSIISSSWILTAAHCMVGVLPSQVKVYAGSKVRFSGQFRVATKVIVHPSYVSSKNINDIALIQLITPFTMPSSTIKTICLPSIDSATLSAGEWPSAGLSVVAAGWGTLSESGSLPLNLQQVTVQTIDYRILACSSVLNDRQKQFCAGVLAGGKDTCQGDSGGPLMMYTTSKQWVLVGLTSYGYGCARANAMGIYTRVAFYQDWISLTTSGAYTIAISSDSARINPSSSNSTTEPNYGTSISPLPALLFSLVSIVLYL